MKPPGGVAAAWAWLRRHPFLVGALLLLIAVRLALPFALRPLLVQNINDALLGSVEIGDLDLSLLRGGVGLHDVAVRAETGAPVFTATRLWAQIGWLALLRRQLVLQELELGGYALNLDRSSEGRLVLPEPKPSPEEEVEEEEAGGPATWSVLVQGVQLDDGRLSFRDFSVGDPPNVVELNLDRLTADEVPIVVIEADRAPGRLRLEARYEDGRFALEATLASSPAGTSIVSHLTAENLPIRRTLRYLTEFGWKELRGRLNADLEHRLEANGAHRLGGRVALDDVAVLGTDETKPLLGWKRLVAELQQIDFVTRHAALAKLSLEGARVIVEPAGKAPVPAVARAASKPPTGAETSVSAAPAAGAVPWSWEVAEVALADSTAQVEGKSRPLEISIEASAKGIGSREGRRAPVSLAVRAGEGSLGLDGDLSLSPLSLAGKLRWQQLDLPLLLDASGAPTAALVRSGSSSGALDVALARAQREGGAGEGDLRLSGELEVAQLAVAGENEQQFSAKIDRLALDVREAVMPGLLAKDVAPRGPIRVTLDRARLARPNLRLTRTPAGFLLPKMAAAAETETPAAAAAAEEAEPAGSPLELRVEVAKAEMERARVRLEDRTVDPVYRSVVDPIDVTAVSVRWPGPAAETFTLTARGLSGAEVEASGRIEPGSSKLSIQLRELPLAPFNTYAAASGYRVEGGRASLRSKLTQKPDGSYRASNRLVLHRLGVAGEQGDALFQQRFGVPLSVALALMTDVQGNISLRIPLTLGGEGTDLGLTTAVGNALAKAIVNAIASPLKIVSAVASVGGKVESITPQPLRFLPGRAQFAEAEAARVEALADLLAHAPALGLRLEGVTTPEDARWLAEQALLERLEASGRLGALRQLGALGSRNAVIEHLRARAAGQASELAPEHRPWFEEQVAAQKLPAAKLLALADARVRAVQAQLLEEHAVASERIEAVADSAPGEGALPSVVVGFGAVGKPGAPAAAGEPAG